MAVIPIQSLDDIRLDAYRHLRHPNRSVRRGSFVVEGHLLVERLAASRFPLESVLLRARMIEHFVPLLSAETPVYLLPDAGISQLVGFRFHRGVLACGRRLPGAPLAECVPRTGAALVIVCPELQDPENLGTILRGSAAFGASAVVLGPECPDVFSRRVMRVSMGAAIRMPVITTDDIPGTLRELQTNHQMETWAAVLDQATHSIGRVAFPERLVLLLGREDRGLSEAMISQVGQSVTIPMQQGTDSLNVAMAATIFMHEWRRSRVV